MSDANVLARIDAWLDAGLIDAPTAARLREAETSQPRKARGTSLSAIFGPTVAVGEMFAYVGGGFLLAAWYALIGRLDGGSASQGMTWAIGTAVVAIAAGGLGLAIRDASPRLRRAAGVAFLISGVNFGASALLAVGRFADFDSVAPLVAGAAAWLAAALVARRIHPSMLTQVGLIGAILASAGALLRWLELVIFGQPSLDFGPPEPESPIRVVLVAAGWGMAAVVLGVVGLVESRSAAPEARPRAALTRFAAGMTAVLGTAAGVFASGNLGNEEYGRLIEPLVGDIVLGAVSAVLLERAFRREASAFVYPAALGVIIALSDLNANYLATATSAEFALLVEGAILLAAGFAFDRLRRRVGASAEAEPPISEPIPDSTSA